jgi:rRNA-processing protein FCF1
MMEVLLDSSFIISCIRERIDFLSQLEGQGFKVVVPREVMQELKDLRKKSSLSHEDRVAIDVAFEIIENNKLKKTKIGGKKVDEGLINKGREGVYVATLDAVIKREIPNKIIINKSRKFVEKG